MTRKKYLGEFACSSAPLSDEMVILRKALQTIEK
jgi:hypothetical protein